MKDEERKISLFCISCDKETTHTVQYVSGYLKSTTCDTCGKVIQMDRRHLRAVFAEDFINRILTKPHRMNEDMKKAIATLAPFFPKRLLNEPMQVLKEIYAVLKKEEEVNKKEK